MKTRSPHSPREAAARPRASTSFAISSSSIARSSGQATRQGAEQHRVDQRRTRAPRHAQATVVLLLGRALPQTHAIRREMLEVLFDAAPHPARSGQRSASSSASRRTIMSAALATSAGVSSCAASASAELRWIAGGSLTLTPTLTPTWSRAARLASALGASRGREAAARPRASTSFAISSSSIARISGQATGQRAEQHRVDQRRTRAPRHARRARVGGGVSERDRLHGRVCEGRPVVEMALPSSLDSVVVGRARRPHPPREAAARPRASTSFAISSSRIARISGQATRQGAEQHRVDQRRTRHLVRDLVVEDRPKFRPNQAGCA